jgi:SAM-dependent methyltransferase
MSKVEKKYWSDWFSLHIPVWDNMFETHGLKGTHFLNFLEIGCFEGRATNYMLENVLTGKDCKIHVIDTFGGSLEETGMVWDSYDFSKLYDTFVNNTSEHRDKVVIHRGLSSKLLRTDFEDNFFDFVYVDGSHTAPDVLQDAVLSHPLLKIGGILMFDDYGWKDVNNPDPTNSPQMAVDFFYNIYRHKYRIIQEGYQIGLQKTAN